MISIPPDVLDWLRQVFARCNVDASRKLTTVPNCHEPWLDFSIIENLQHVSAPFKFGSDWIVNINTHWLGSAPLWPHDEPRWEVADIGVLVMFRTATKLIRSKVALLQTKRLYAEKQKPESEQELRQYYRRGFGRMFGTDDQFAEMTKPKLYHFDCGSEYSALTKGSDQWLAIEQYEEHKEIPVYYMFYNPLRVPIAVSVPHDSAEPASPACEVGCRVIPSKHVREAMNGASDGRSPSYGMLASGLGAPFNVPEHSAGWSLEHFVVDLLLQCKTGRIMDLRNDQSLYNVFYRRSGPIQAAIAVTIDAPDGFEWDVEPDAAG